MEIHKPKAAHSWREFLIEIGTIICGILIALGLEQVVEGLHWRHGVEEEREALRDEITHLHAAILGRLSIDDCFQGRLAEVREVIRRHDAGVELGIVHPVGRPLYPPVTRPLWELAVTDQSLAHMPLDEKRRYLEAYQWVLVYDRISTDERTAWRGLQVLNHADKLLPADWSQVRSDYEHADETRAIIVGSVDQWTAPIRAIAAATAPTPMRDKGPVKAFCTPLLAGGVGRAASGAGGA